MAAEDRADAVRRRLQHEVEVREKICGADATASGRPCKHARRVAANVEKMIADERKKEKEEKRMQRALEEEAKRKIKKAKRKRENERQKRRGEKAKKKAQEQSSKTPSTEPSVQPASGRRLRIRRSSTSVTTVMKTRGNLKKMRRTLRRRRH